MRGLALLFAVSLLTRAVPLAAQSTGNSIIYMPTFDNAITMVDEATGTTVGRIPMRTTPWSLVLSENRQRFYITDMLYETIEVIDIANRRTVDSFSLSRGARKVRIWSAVIDPTETYGIFLAKNYFKLPDRFEVSDPMLLKVDLKTHEVTDTLAFPDNRKLDGARMMFSPDGKLLYVFADRIIALETTNFKEVDRWEFAEALDPGLGRFSFGFPEQNYEEPGVFTGMFTLQDSVQDRRLMGVARVHLSDRKVEFFALGPAQNVTLAVAPGGHRAYGLHSETGNYQFWTFDLDQRRVVSRTNFPGRPRMRMITSSDGNHLYVYQAGNTIDVYDAATYQKLRTITIDADMVLTSDLFVLPKGAANN